MANIDLIKSKILPILRKYDIRKATLVGSAARGDDNAGSDIDLVVKIDKQISLLTFSRIKIELQEALHRKVDLIEISSLKPRLKINMLKDELIIL